MMNPAHTPYLVERAGKMVPDLGKIVDAPDEIYFGLLQHNLRLREVQEGDPTPLIPIWRPQLADGRPPYQLLAVATRGGKTLLYAIEEHISIPPVVLPDREISALVLGIPGGFPVSRPAILIPTD